MAPTPVIRPIVAALLLGGCTATGLAVEDPHPDIQQEVWNIASRCDTPFKAGGMAGVTQEVESCYRSATVPVTKIWALRDCLILDYTGFYTDMKVGRRLNHISLPYFVPETFAARTTRYAKMDGFTSPAVALPFGWIISLPELRSAAWRENIGCGYSQSLPQKVIVPAQAAPEFRRSADIAEPEQDHRVAAMCGLVFSLQRAYPMRNSHSESQVLDLTADVYRGDSTS